MLGVQVAARGLRVGQYLVKSDRVRVYANMAPVSTQRLVPIRPSPLKGVTSPQTIKVLTPVSVATPTTLVVKTGAKRKLADDMANQVVKCKKQNTGVTGSKSSQLSSMGRRNARERNRVKQVNNSFTTLRQHIPGAAKAKKISKVETLKQAVDYIRGLQELLEEHDAMIAESKPNIVNGTVTVSNVAASNNANNIHSQFLSTDSTQSQSVNSVQHQQQQNVLHVKSHTDTITQQSPPLLTNNYFFSENISPVSPTVYPINTQDQAFNNTHLTTQTIFKTEVVELPTPTTFSTPIENLAVTPTYSNSPTPSVALPQQNFTLVSQSSPYSTSSPVPSIYQTTTVAYSPNSIQDQHSPNSTAAQFSPNSLSPSSSPPGSAAPEFSPCFSRIFDETSTPSLIKARNFIIPASELHYCLTPGVSTIDIEKATATTKDDLEVLDAIAMWQDC